MGRITSGVGLISGINTTDIINQLISLEQAPKTQLQARKDTVSAQKDAYAGIITQLTDLQTAGKAFERPTTFTASKAESSDKNVLTATTGASAAVGSYQFQVARLVTSQQSVTAGFADTSATVGAGNLTIELGGGDLGAATPLSQLNGGTGVRRGLFRITDRAGKTAVIDTTSAVTLDDVIRKINTSLDISVHAAAAGDKLVLTDTSGAAAAAPAGATVPDLKVEDLADGFAAADLGIAGSAAADTLTGTNVVSLGPTLALAALNDGRGVRLNATGADFVVTARDGSKTNVTIGPNAKTVGDVLTAINAAGGGKFKAQVTPGGNGLQLVDTTGGGGVFSVAPADANSHAAQDLGLLAPAAGATLNGADVLAGLDTVLLSSLRGGTGLPLGSVSITNRAGAAHTVDLSGAKTVQDVIAAINSTAGIGVTASLKTSGNGVQLTDQSGGTGNLVVADVNSTTAAALGIAGSFDLNKPAVQGANLQLQWVSENSLLSTYNGGKGVTPGLFTITNSAGQSVDIDLASGTFNKLGDVIAAINAKGVGVTASINANGDGLLLTDTAGGANKLKVEDQTGTAAADLNIAETAAVTAADPAGKTIDGSFEKTIALTDVDTLGTVQSKIQQLGFGVSANLVNDGSAASPYRLSLSAFNSGRAGRVVIDGGASNLGVQNLVAAQDAAVFVGGGNGSGTTSAAQPLLITSGKNELTNVVPGVTIDLHGIGSGPVTLNVTRDPDGVVDQVKKFVDGFNGVVSKIDDLTKYDTDTQTAGLLLGDGTITDVQSQLYVALQASVKGAGQYRLLADVGVTLGDGAKLEFDESKFRTAFATDPEAVKNLFTQVAGTTLSDATPLAQLNGGAGVRRAGSRTSG